MRSFALIAALVIRHLHLTAAALSDPRPGKFSDYECTPTLTALDGRPYTFDLTPISSSDLSLPLHGYNWRLRVCGVHSQACLPVNTVRRPIYASALQMYNTSAPNATCWNPVLGVNQSCTQNCEPLSEGHPIVSLLNASNPSQGLNMTFAGVPAMPEEREGCGYDPSTGRDQPRTTLFLLLCNASLPVGAAVPVYQDEGPACHYVFTIQSAAACGVVDTVARPFPGPAVPTYPDAGPFAPYLTEPWLTDDHNATWNFNISSLWNAHSDYTASGFSPDNHYLYSIAGTASSSCVPVGYEVEQNWGSAIALPGTRRWQLNHTGDAPAAAAAAANCSLINGTRANCTEDCRVVARGPPVVTLMDPSNGGSGGLSVTYLGVGGGAYI